MQDFVARRVVQGMPNKEIARECGITAGAVTSHLKRAAWKLGYRKRTGAGVRAFVAAKVTQQDTLAYALRAIDDCASLGQAKARLKLLLQEIQP
jgi:DNA-binding CsgD family transcriptional regulator